MIYEEDEVVGATREYFKGDDLATSVWVNKYALRDNSGRWLEKDPSDMHLRLAKELARIEKKYKNPLDQNQIFNLLDKYKYVVLQGSPMSGMGNNHQIQSLSNCFTIESPHDSYGGILKTDQEMVQLMKRRGGVGFDISSIRPKDLATNNAARTTDGISCFLNRYSNSTREVAQNGRRGALMITISIHHPEIRTFINIKRDLTKITGANISIRITDEFMKSVEENKDFELYWPMDGSEKQVSEMVNAKELWGEIVSSARDMAEPGLIFWDTVLNNSPADSYKEDGFETISCNPCSEIMLSAYDSCRLVLINLTSYVESPYTRDAFFNITLFGDHVQKAQRIMDDLVDLEIEKIDKILKKINSDPEPEEVKRVEVELWKKIKKSCVDGRRTGLGITGLGDTIAAVGMRYGSSSSIDLTNEIYKNLAINAYKSSCVLASERGAFPVWSKSKDEGNNFLNRLYEESDELKEMAKGGRRNIAILTTAPCGSTSTQTQTSSGIEPVIFLKYKRRRKLSDSDVDSRVDFVDDLGDKWQEYEVYHHGVEKWMKIKGRSDHETSPYWKATANDIDWISRVKLQAEAQKWIDHAISSTCNLPKDVTDEEVGKIYFEAWKSGCKGFTVYREGSRSGVIIDDKSKENKEDDKSKEDDKNRGHKRDKLPMDRVAINHKFSIGGHTGFLTVGFYADGKVGEIFVRMSKAGSTINGLLDSWAKAISMLLQHSVSLEEIIDNFEGVAFEPAGFTNCENVRTARSAIDYIVKILKQRFVIGRGANMDFDLFFDNKFIDNESVMADTMVPYSIDSPPCAKCGAIMHKVGGCHMCPSCGETGGCG